MDDDWSKGSDGDVKVPPVDERRLRRFALGLLAVVLSLSVASTAGFYLLPEEDDWRDGGSTEWTEDRSPGDYLYLVIPDWWAADLANARIVTLGVGNASIVDLDEEDADSQLVLDHEMGHVTYWEIWDYDVEVTVNARTGQIISYWQHSDVYNGTVAREEVRAMAVRVANHFGGIPLDAVGPFINRECHRITNGVEQYEWYVHWYRERDGIPTTDHIRMIFDLEGTLHFYYRDWNMELTGLDTRYTVTREEAIDIASGIAGDEAPLVSCERMIVRPMGAMAGEDLLWGTDPCPVWSVEFDYNSDTYVACVQVHARTGEVVGGDWWR